MSRRRSILKAKKPGGGVDVPGFLGDATRKSRGASHGPVLSVQDFGQVSSPDADALGQFGDGSLEGVVVSSHDSNVLHDTTESSPYSMDLLRLVAETPSMDKFPGRAKFRTAILAYRKKHGITPDQMADILNMKPSGLHGLLYDKRTGYSVETIQKACALMGASITEFIDDPGAPPPPGIDEEDFRLSSEEDRVYLRAMYSGLQTIPTPEQKRHAMDAWAAIVRGYQESIKGGRKGE